MRKQQRFAIDGVVYIFTQLGATEGVDLFHDLRKVALPELRRLLADEQLLALLDTKSTDAEALLAKLDAVLIAKLGSVILGLVEAMPKQLERDLRRAFALNCDVGTPAIGQHGAQDAFVPLGDPSVPDGRFDQHFAGQYGSYQKWFLTGLKFNFAGFLGGSGSGSSPASPATPSP